jgi:hypothetical protein
VRARDAQADAFAFAVRRRVESRVCARDRSRGHKVAASIFRAVDARHRFTLISAYDPYETEERFMDVHCRTATRRNIEK